MLHKDLGKSDFVVFDVLHHFLAEKQLEERVVCFYVHAMEV